MGRKGTNELISGEKPFIAILSNLKCLFTRLKGDEQKNDFIVIHSQHILIIYIVNVK